MSYQNYYENFDISELDKHFHGSLEGDLNAAIECCDRYACTDKIALYYEGAKGEKEVISFLKLKEESSKIANLLISQGVEPGDAISGMMPRTPELLYIILGTWKAGAVYQPLFTAFGPKSVEQRLSSSKAKILFTDNVNRPKLSDVKNAPQICVFNRDVNYIHIEGDLDLKKETKFHSPDFKPVMRKSSDIMALLSTSGTTGLPKAVPIPLKALYSFKLYMDLAVDLRAEDRFWNLADPGWAYGLYYSVIGPLVNGNALLFYEGGFSAEETVRIINDYKITNLAGSPTAYRLLIGGGSKVVDGLKGKLRAVSSAGEPLNPEVIRWFKDELGVVVNDHYGQTELGMVVNNHHALEHKIKPGSMGYAMPGYRVAVLNEEAKEVPANTPGVLAIDMNNSPVLWFYGYHKTETQAISDGYYKTGDTVEQAEDGLVTYVGRNDDVITSSGYRIGPFDVESALLEHPAVLEVAAIGKPDPERTEIVKAFVVLGKDYKPSEVLKSELSLFVKKSLAAHAYPKEIEFLQELPKTPSGKVQRFILRSQQK